MNSQESPQTPSFSSTPIWKRHPYLLSFYILFCLNFFSAYLLLDKRPLHHDEAVVSYYFPDQVLKTGRYRYDPTNYHGPLYYYIQAFSQKWLGDAPETLRLPITVCRATMTLLPLILWPQISLWSIWVFGLLLLTSPFLWFFAGMFAIHESFLDFFLLITGLGLARFARTHHTRSLLWVLGGILGMSLIKETYVLFLGAVLATIILADIYKRSELTHFWNLLLTHRFQILIYGGLGLFIYAAFYTEGFTYPKGFLNSFKSFFPWGDTAAQQGGHAKPFSYFISLFFTYEVPLWSALFICLAWLHQSRLAQFFLCVSIIHVLLYSLIPYKTPWCMPTLVTPFFLVPFFVLPQISLASRKFALGSLGLIAVIWWGIFGYQFGIKVLPPNTPFSYVHSDMAYKKLSTLLQAIEADPKGREAKSAILIHQSYWPLPYYFRKFKHTGYFNQEHKLKQRQLMEFQILILTPTASPVPIETFKQDYEILPFNHFIQDPMYLLIQKTLIPKLTPQAQAMIHL